MKGAPKTVGGARVVRWSMIDDRHRPTSACTNTVAGQLQQSAAGLAICRYEGDQAYYLFGCDEEWNSITDTWHHTLEEALQQAEVEYEGVSATWNVV